MKTADDLPIAKACPLEGELPGEGPSRHCAACDTVVVDLSLLTANDADALLRSPARPRCVSYLVDERGAVLHQPPPPVARRRLPLWAGAVLLAACHGTPSTDPASGSTAAPVVAAPTSTPAPVPLRGEIEAPAAPAASAMNGEESCDHDAKPATTAATSARPPAPQPVGRPIMKRGKPARFDDGVY